MRRVKFGVLAAALVLISAGCNSLYDNWSGQPQWSADTTFSAPAVNTVHTESAAVYFNNHYFMYHRSRVSPGVDRFDIGYSTSTNGDVWTSAGIAIHHNDGGVGCGSVYAPKVLIEATMLTMVYEADPNGPGCTAPYGLRQYVAMAHSTDGVHWSNFKVLIVPQRGWEGWNGSSFVGNTGTPTITKDASGYWIGYHGFNGGSQLRRGIAFASLSAAPNALAITSATLTRYPNPMSFTTQSGGALNPALWGVGEGEADVIQWQAGSGGDTDNAFYMVLEGFAGSPLCGQAATKTIVAIARATSPAGPWAIQDKVLLGQKADCGRDMPAWQYDIGDHHYKVVLTQTDASGLQRLTLVNTYL